MQQIPTYFPHPDASWEVKKLRNTTKVAIALAIAALAIVLVIPKAAGVPNQSNITTQASSASLPNAQQLPSGAWVYDGAGCQDLSAQVTGYDQITGAPCSYTGP